GLRPLGDHPRGRRPRRHDRPPLTATRGRPTHTRARRRPIHSCPHPRPTYPQNATRPHNPRPVRANLGPATPGTTPAPTLLEARCRTSPRRLTAPAAVAGGRPGRPS